MATAILVDGGFFLKRFRHVYPHLNHDDPAVVARAMHDMSLAHLSRRGQPVRDLYRVFFYDCPPLTKKAHNPVSKRAIDFSKSPLTTFRIALHEEIRRLRKTALRLGRLDEDNAAWQLKQGVLKKLLSGSLSPLMLSEFDVHYYARQKVVDMKIGLDIASLAYKRQVDQIVLVSGDSDFVPAAKLARREGIDFVLDPMWHAIKPDLTEHIDGPRSCAPRPPWKAAAEEGDEMAGSGGDSAD